MSGFLLDTCVVSELIKAKPAAKVIRWIGSIGEDLLYLSVLTIGEIRKGICQVEEPARRNKLEAWLVGSLSVRFDGRILEIGQDIAERWGMMTARAKSTNRALPVIDGLLAATAQNHNLTLVTRNIDDVIGTGVSVFNPWD